MPARIEGRGGGHLPLQGVSGGSGLAGARASPLLELLVGLKAQQLPQDVESLSVAGSDEAVALSPWRRRTEVTKVS